MGVDNSSNTGAGVHTIIFALKTILYNTDERQKQKVITPQYFGKTMKGQNVHDNRNVLNKSEIQRYRNQLLNAFDYWDDPNWKVEKRERNSLRLIFTRRETVDRGG